MCGILGEFVFNRPPIKEEEFLSLLGLSKRRGPDSTSHIKINNILQLGFNRLSILDLSDKADQPIRSPSGRYTMVFNGEVYNHKELRRNLPSNKYQFFGNGDTESIIICFDEYGILPTIRMLDGMFAIGVFDNKEKQLYLVRDFAGIKPLYYGYSGELLVFASQYDQIVKHPVFYDNEIDQKVLKLYLSQHFIPAPYGLLRNTFQVMPGELIIINKNGDKEHERYWELPKKVDNSN